MDGVEVILIHLHDGQRRAKTVAFNEVHDPVQKIAAIAEIPDEPVFVSKGKLTARPQGLVSKMQRTYSTFTEQI